MRLIAYDMNGDPAAWDKIVKTDVDIAFIRNMAEPPGHIAPYLNSRELRFDSPTGIQYQRRVAVVIMNKSWRAMNTSRPNLAEVYNYPSVDRFYMVDRDAGGNEIAQCLSGWNAMIVCSELDVKLEERGLTLIQPQLYSLSEAPPLRIYVRDSRQWCSHEIVDVDTGTQDDPQMVITTEWKQGSESVMLLPIRDTRTEFLKWFKRSHEIYIAFGDGGTMCVPCSHVRMGVVPTYKGKPIMFWNARYW